MRESIKQYGWDKDAFIRFSHQIFNSIGRFQLMLLFMLSARPAYAVFFEAGTSLLFRLFTAVWCVFAAKVGL